ncbi:MAG: ATP-binding protein [Candidatus Krumholzibacteria bacterium]|nr:ATP-binding protein [Candidatus Krumholzibacteria bacterium]
MAGTIIIEFPSDYKYLNLVDLACGEVISGLCAGHNAANEIAISVIEAVTNAIEHGNCQCPDENVRVVFSCKPDRLCVEVADCGKGFDFECYIRNMPDPTNIQHLRGRGIYIMKNLMDSVDFEMVPGKGMKVKLEKLLQPKDSDDGRKD